MRSKGPYPKDYFRKHPEENTASKFIITASWVIEVLILLVIAFLYEKYVRGLH